MKKQESPGFSRGEQVKRVYIDIETYSEVPLKKSNVYRYAEDPTFEILMLAYAVDDSPVEVVEGHEACVAKFRELRAEADVLVAHNAQFERVCFSYACRDLFLPPAEWDDPMVRAYVYGYPGSLDLLTKALKVSHKDDDGKRLIRKFSCPCPANQKRRRWFAEDAPEDWAKFVDYCRQDVEALRAVDRELAALPAFERELWELDQTICDRGVRLDVAMAEKAVEVNSSITADLSQQVADLLGIENPKSVQQFTAALAEAGVEMQSLDKKAVAKALLRDDLPEKARKALELRQELALSAVAKYQAELRIVNKDSRMRGLVRYFGAHTGRWAGTGPQLHNLPNNTPPPGRLAAGYFDLMYLGQSSPEMLKAMIRSSILGPVTVVDFSAIEGRVIAWLAGEQWVLDAYREGRDVYVETARQMKFFTPDGEPDRKAGKVAVLACGYQGSVGALRNMGASGTDAQLKRLAYAWRDANPSIVKLWADLEAVFMRTGEVNPFLRVERARHNGRALLLPSGRPICYRYLTPSEDGILYVNRYGFRKSIYGGLLAENCVSGEAEVLTEKGWVSLDQVGDELVWDGEEFVRHEGLVSKGRQYTVDVSGVRMTADHKVLTEEGWRDASSTDGLNRSPVQTCSRDHGGSLAVSPGHWEEVYDILNCGPRHRFVVRPSGGGEPMIVHNCTQAVARDLLALSLLRLEEAGYEVLLHVHDEVVIAGEHDPEEIARIMCTLPEWAEGLPLAAHGGVLERYGKPD